MLTTTEKDLIQSVYKAVESVAPRFRKRPQQAKMIAATAHAIADGVVQLVEAPTGTGKSFGFLIPGLVLAHTRQRRLIVSTATVALQDQLWRKDFPVIREAFAKCGIHVTSSLMRGRERYVCNLKLIEGAAQGDLLESGKVQDEIGGLRGRLESGEWSGVRDDLQPPVSDAVWKEVYNDRHSCARTACPRFSDCSFYSTIESAEQSTLVIVNHDLLLKTIAQSLDDDRSPLTRWDENFYVFDEGHHLPDKGAKAFAQEFVCKTDFLDSVRGAIPKSNANAQYNRAVGLIEQGRASIRALAVRIRGVADPSSGIMRFPLGVLTPEIEREALSVAACLESLADVVSKCIEMHEKQFGKDFNFGRAGLLRARSVLREQAQSLAVFVKKDNPNEKPEARWVSVSEGAPKCVTSPWDVSRFFRTAVFGRMQGVLVASATLAALGTFRSILRDLGLPDDTRTLQLQSPFDHSGSRMVVPKLAIDPSNMRMHTAILKAFVVERALKHADGGVLVYFSARARMQAVLEQLSEEQRECVLAQGDYSVPGIIEVHKRRIDEGKRSVIFGLDSFAEGIDLPGRYCTLMIVDKIPFPAPNEPLIAAATEWITAQGGNAFSIVTLPRTGRKLAQLTGRLVRQEGDSGTIYVLDTRLLNKPYGRQLAAGTAYQPQVDY